MGNEKYSLGWMFLEPPNDARRDIPASYVRLWKKTEVIAGGKKKTRYPFYFMSTFTFSTFFACLHTRKYGICGEVMAISRYVNQKDFSKSLHPTQGPCLQTSEIECCELE